MPRTIFRAPEAASAPATRVTACSLNNGDGRMGTLRSGLADAQRKISPNDQRHCGGIIHGRHAPHLLQDPQRMHPPTHRGTGTWSWSGRTKSLRQCFRAQRMASNGRPPGQQKCKRGYGRAGVDQGHRRDESKQNGRHNRRSTMPFDAQNALLIDGHLRTENGN